MSKESEEDLTSKARIRDAAIACIAEEGVTAATVRKIAVAAGVSPGLVIHHYRSMDGLRAACDDHVAASIRRVKEDAMTAGPGLDVLAALRETRIGPVVGYLARTLVEEAPAVTRLVDDLVADAEQYLEQGVESGMLRPTGDTRGRAAVLALWSLGALVLHRHVERILGIDLTDPQLGADPALAAYLGPAYEILGRGVFTEDAAAALSSAAAQLGGSSMPDPDTTKGP